jgi:23S rRNA (pseudouridine1915-N3)-methyltransferase
VKIQVLWFGRPGRSPFEDEVATYRRRVSRRWPAEDVPLKPDRRRREHDPVGALDHEADILLHRIPDGHVHMALDERGSEMSSPGLARFLGELHEAATTGVVLTIGSDLGLSPRVCASARRTWSLGRLTLPHLLARLVVWEQLYRASDILASGRYHRCGLE